MPYIMSNEKEPGCLGYVEDEILPSFVGIMINHYTDPYETTSISWKVEPFFLKISCWIGGDPKLDADVAEFALKIMAPVGWREEMFYLVFWHPPPGCWLVTTRCINIYIYIHICIYIYDHSYTISL